MAKFFYFLKRLEWSGASDIIILEFHVYSDTQKQPHNHHWNSVLLVLRLSAILSVIASANPIRGGSCQGNAWAECYLSDALFIQNASLIQMRKRFEPHV